MTLQEYNHYLELSNDFYKEIQELGEISFNKIKNILSDPENKIYEIKLLIELPEDSKIKYNIKSKYLDFILSVNANDYPNSTMNYLYGGEQINPDCMYIRCKGYKKVPILVILQECIKQNKSNPEITKIEKELSLL